jgi:hypothetical protein
LLKNKKKSLLFWWPYLRNKFIKKSNLTISCKSWHPDRARSNRNFTESVSLFATPRIVKQTKIDDGGGLLASQHSYLLAENTSHISIRSPPDPQRTSSSTLTGKSRKLFNNNSITSRKRRTEKQIEWPKTVTGVVRPCERAFRPVEPPSKSIDIN